MRSCIRGKSVADRFRTTGTKMGNSSVHELFVLSFETGFVYSFSFGAARSIDLSLSSCEHRTQYPHRKCFEVLDEIEHLQLSGVMT